ncbi:MAG: family 10 glycosylhydrolase [Ignavibacteriae bacterium]|nr:family 10 glycosylhydrolase [Ignavibacteriota bacterium]
MELRGVWLTNVDSHVLESRGQIAAAMQFLADHHFNLVYPVVWNKGMTLYRSDVMKQSFDIDIDTLTAYRGRDPLAEVIEEAHKRNIAVIPWFEFGFAASHNDRGGHILRTKPHWAAQDREGKLLAKNGFEWMNAYHPEVQEFMLALVTEVVRKYNIDGVQGDDRLPAQPIEGGYDAWTAARYAGLHNGKMPPWDFREKEWQRWRADQLNAFARKLYRHLKSIKPAVVVSWSPSIYPWSFDEYLQDWRAWISLDSSGHCYADLIHPQNYRYEIGDYKKTLDTQSRDSMRVNNTRPYLYPGILLNVGSYLMSEEYLQEAIRYNRACGYAGEVFFFYEGLRKENDKMAKLLKEHFYQTPARLPFTPAFLKTK